MGIKHALKKTKAYADAAKSSADRFRDGSSVFDSIKGSAADFKNASMAGLDDGYRFIQSERFNGYKRFKVSYYGYEPAETGLRQFRRLGYPLQGAEILLKYSKRDFYQFIDVYVSGFFIGSIFLTDQESENVIFLKKRLLTGHVTGAHLRFETETIIGKNKLGRIITEERDKIFLFLKSEV